MNLPGVLHAILLLIMGQKAFPQVSSVLGVTPVYGYMVRIGCSFPALSSHIYFLTYYPDLVIPQGSHILWKI